MKTKYVRIPFEEYASPGMPKSEIRSFKAGPRAATDAGGVVVRGIQVDLPLEDIVSFRIGGSPQLLAHHPELKHRPDFPQGRFSRAEGSAVDLIACPILLYPNQGFLELRIDPSEDSPTAWLIAAPLQMLTGRQCLEVFTGERRPEDEGEEESSP